MTFRCGHPQSDENTLIDRGTLVCRICANAKALAWWHRQSPERKAEIRGRASLPQRLKLARAKVARLEADAVRFGLSELVERRDGHG